jgi:hypothetical protein
MSARNLVTLSLDTGGQIVATAKTFSSGSVGFYAGDKVMIDGERYQVSLSVVKIGSKPGAVAKPGKK